MLEKRIALVSFINVFDVAPTFLLPLFTDGDNFLFQKIENDKIAFFVEANLNMFNDSTKYKIDDGNKIFAIGDNAVYAIDVTERKYVYGDRETIESYYFDNMSFFENHPDFCDYMMSFLRVESTISREKKERVYALNNIEESSSTALSILDFELVTKEPSNELTLSIKRHYNELLSIVFHKYNLHEMSLQSGISDSIHMFENWFVNKHIPNILNIDLNNDNKILFQNKDYMACLFNNMNAYFTDDIYLFKKVTNNENSEEVRRIKKIHSSIMYKKSDQLKLFPSISIESQCKILDILLYSSPSEYFGNLPSKMLRYYSGNKFSARNRRYVIESNSLLWNENALYELFLSVFKRNDKLILNSLLEEWGVVFPKPLFEKRIDLINDNSAINIWWDEILPQIEMDAENDESKLFWCTIKALSCETSTFVIIAQDYYTQSDQFVLIDHKINYQDMIQFISALFNDVESKLTLIFDNINDFACDAFFDWLNNNDEKCTIRTTPLATNINIQG